MLKKRPAHVLAVTNLYQKQNVYNLTVKDSHEYYANDVLVSNCDGLRYIAMSRPDYFEHPKLNMYGLLEKEEEEDDQEYDINENIDEMMGGDSFI